jgi:Sec-independent protein secretion pathway component TatC
VVSQLMLAIPMCLLYELGLFAAQIIVRRRTAVSSRQVEYQ